MNVSTYFFGYLDEGYFQYPYDYTSDIFKSFVSHCKASSQLVIHRDGDLMYYGYVRKLDEKKYLGFCWILNGKYLTNINNLFGVFENLQEILLRKGYLVFNNNNGDIVYKLSISLTDKRENEQIDNILASSFTQQDIATATLPAVSYSVVKNTINSCSLQDDDIINLSYTNSYTVVYKSKDFKAANKNSFKSVEADLDNEIQTIKEEIKKLKLSGGKTKFNKALIALLSIIIFVLFCVICYNLSSEKGRTYTYTNTIKNVSSENDVENNSEKMIPKVPENHNEETHFANILENTPKEANEKKLSLIKSEMKEKQQRQNTNEYTLRGYVLNESFPIQIKIFEKDGEIVKCEYKNIKYGTVLNMSGRETSRGFVFESISRGSTLYIEVFHRDGELVGWATEGGKKLETHLYK